MLMELEVRNSNRGAQRKAYGIKKLTEKLAKYTQWVSDLQSGMYINCVYCGHRYGGTSSGGNSQEVLKAHIEVCPDHPMSELKKENEYLRRQLESLKNARVFHS